MTKPQFSPGPWEIKDKYTICGKDAVKDALMGNDPSICHICTVNGWLVSAENNALLIAQCPNMIEFICDIVSACDYGTETLSEQFRKRGAEIVRKVYGTEGNND